MRASASRSLTAAFRAVAFAAALLSSLGASAECQGKQPQLRSMIDLRIDKTLPGSGRSTMLVLGPAGEMIVAQTQSQGAISGLDSSGHALSWSVPVGGGRDGDIRWITRLGWMGNTLWVADPGFDQLALIDRAGKITKSLEYPSWVRPSWSDRRKYPVFAALEPVALYSDGTWLVRPYQERSVMSTPEFDPTSSYLMRIAENGSIQRVIARLPRDESRIDVTAGNNDRRVAIPFRAIPFRAQNMWDVSSDGARVVLVATSLHGADSATYRVTEIGAKGDTIFSRRFPFVPVPISRQTIDSVRMRITHGIGGRSTDETRDFMVKQLPPVYPPIESVVVGRDGTTWIELRHTTPEHSWLALDAGGAPIGVAEFPKEFVLRAAERGRVWGFNNDGDHLSAIVRYKILPPAAPAKR
jgi:hypothetical protein